MYDTYSKTVQDTYKTAFSKYHINRNDLASETKKLFEIKVYTEKKVKKDFQICYTLSCFSLVLPVSIISSFFLL